MLRVIAVVAFSILSHFRNAWIALAVVPFPGSLNVGVGPSTPNAVSFHDAIMTGAALCVEVALFVLVPLYLRAYRRSQIRSTYRISYDSRRQPAPAVAAVMRVTPGTRRPTLATKRPLRVIEGSRLSA